MKSAEPQLQLPPDSYVDSIFFLAHLSSVSRIQSWGITRMIEVPTMPGTYTWKLSHCCSVILIQGRP